MAARRRNVAKPKKHKYPRSPSPTPTPHRTRSSTSTTPSTQSDKPRCTEHSTEYLTRFLNDKVAKMATATFHDLGELSKAVLLMHAVANNRGSDGTIIWHQVSEAVVLSTKEDPISVGDMQKRWKRLVKNAEDEKEKAKNGTLEPKEPNEKKAPATRSKKRKTLPTNDDGKDEAIKKPVSPKKTTRKPAQRKAAAPRGKGAAVRKKPAKAEQEVAGEEKDDEVGDTEMKDGDAEAKDEDKGTDEEMKDKSSDANSETATTDDDEAEEGERGENEADN